MTIGLRLTWRTMSGAFLVRGGRRLGRRARQADLVAGTERGVGRVPPAAMVDMAFTWSAMSEP
ncbi:hypothetical protein KOI35_23840 [Actinoplanes bogorensis]|uniref:Uncharacterized protein n=1 Tax=Paractinoplanes bogorensis TaxID=1610840 RepID=A0ABS5YV37_9ACTN|nr:hypothetical protein [Actinoplanes bogorensis]MBU2666544.1 hypothetical protein [Actinoplanes bogorensis]